MCCRLPHTWMTLWVQYLGYMRDKYHRGTPKLGEKQWKEKGWVLGPSISKCLWNSGRSIFLGLIHQLWMSPDFSASSVRGAQFFVSGGTRMDRYAPNMVKYCIMCVLTHVLFEQHLNSFKEIASPQPPVVVVFQTSIKAVGKWKWPHSMMISLWGCHKARIAQDRSG